jgi:hypothetical protein
MYSDVKAFTLRMETDVDPLRLMVTESPLPESLYENEGPVIIESDIAVRLNGQPLPDECYARVNPIKVEGRLNYNYENIDFNWMVTGEGPLLEMDPAELFVNYALLHFKPSTHPVVRVEPRLFGSRGGLRLDVNDDEKGQTLVWTWVRPRDDVRVVAMPSGSGKSTHGDGIQAIDPDALPLAHWINEVFNPMRFSATTEQDWQRANCAILIYWWIFKHMVTNQATVYFTWNTDDAIWYGTSSEALKPSKTLHEVNIAARDESVKRISRLNWESFVGEDVVEFDSHSEQAELLGLLPVERDLQRAHDTGMHWENYDQIYMEVPIDYIDWNGQSPYTRAFIPFDADVRTPNHYRIPSYTYVASSPRRSHLRLSFNGMSKWAAVVPRHTLAPYQTLESPGLSANLVTGRIRLEHGIPREVWHAVRSYTAVLMNGTSTSKDISENIKNSSFILINDGNHHGTLKGTDISVSGHVIALIMSSMFLAVDGEWMASQYVYNYLAYYNRAPKRPDLVYGGPKPFWHNVLSFQYGIASFILIWKLLDLKVPMHTIRVMRSLLKGFLAIQRRMPATTRLSDV